MSEEICIPAAALVHLIRHLRAEAAAPPVLRNDAFATFQSGVRHGKQRAANEIAELLEEYGFEVESEAIDV